MSFERPFREDPVRSADGTPALSKIFLFERSRFDSLDLRALADGNVRQTTAPG